MTDFESKWDVTIKEVPILGVVGMGHKAAGGKGTWKGTAHYNQSVIREMGDKYQKTGVMQYFYVRIFSSKYRYPFRLFPKRISSHGH
mgnify:CR=1 FL=1